MFQFKRALTVEVGLAMEVEMDDVLKREEREEV